MDLPRLPTICNIFAHHPRYVLHLALFLEPPMHSVNLLLLLGYIDFKVKEYSDIF